MLKLKNKLIAICGADGVGKRTQADKLASALSDGPSPVTMLSFPQYDTPSGKRVRDYLNGAFGPAMEVDGYLASQLYAIDRATALPLIHETFDQDGNVICDRWVEANLIYQSVKCKGTEEEKAKLVSQLRQMEHEFLGLPEADVTIYLDVDASISKSLLEDQVSESADNGKFDQHESSEWLQEAVRVEHLKWCEREPTWVRVQCMEDGTLLPKETIHEMIMNVLYEMFN